MIADEGSADRRARGLAKLAEVYPHPIEFSEPFSRYTEATVDHLFGDVWSRPGMSTRDRRLLLIGVIAMVDDEDLLTLQFGCALAKGELTPDEVDEIVLFLAHYAGW